MLYGLYFCKCLEKTKILSENLLNLVLEIIILTFLFIILIVVFEMMMIRQRLQDSISSFHEQSS